MKNFRFIINNLHIIGFAFIFLFGIINFNFTELYYYIRVFHFLNLFELIRIFLNMTSLLVLLPFILQKKKIGWILLNLYLFIWIGFNTAWFFVKNDTDIYNLNGYLIIFNFFFSVCYLVLINTKIQLKLFSINRRTQLGTFIIAILLGLLSSYYYIKLHTLTNLRMSPAVDLNLGYMRGQGVKFFVEPKGGWGWDQGHAGGILIGYTILKNPNWSSIGGFGSYHSGTFFL